MTTTTTTTTTQTRRAIGIVRVSQVAGREGESFASPGEQRDRIATACERDGLHLTETIEELDVSGGTPLERRGGLRRAVETIEQGKAEVLAVAYLDRLCRSLAVQGEVVERVEAAGGQVLAVDVGLVTNGSAGQWLSGTMLGLVSEYQRRTIGERSGEAQARAVARGVAPFPRIPAGYRRDESGRLEPDEHAPAVAQAFALRAEGATIAEVRAHLAAHGVTLSYPRVRGMFSSRIVLGELRFGDLINLTAHPPIVERELWERVQRVSVPRGVRPTSERLLSRLGILRCSSCDSRLVIGSQNRKGRRYSDYRCSRVHGDCPRKVGISATVAEEVVVEAMREALEGCVGTRAARDNLTAARTAARRAEDDLDAALRTLADFTDEPAAVERLVELRRRRDEARDLVEGMAPADDDVFVLLGQDWDTLAVADQRRCIRATIDRVVVAPAERGVPPRDRLEVHYHRLLDKLHAKTPQLPRDLSPAPRGSTTPPLVTSRYRAVHDLAKTGAVRGFLPVRTSVGSPRFISEAESWPKVGMLAPDGLINIKDRDEFEARYRKRLDSHGVPAIAAALHAIYVGQPAPRLPLALLCFEDLDKGDEDEVWCHRRTFAAWWEENTGQAIEDCNTAEALGSLPGDLA
jgi:DNA invertase Pin-like site-specific DNA recombinase